MIFVQGHVSEFVLFVKTRIFLSSGGCPIWGELSWEQHFILTCPMHHPCLAICKMNKLQEQDNCAKDPAASLIVECFHQHKLHCIRLTHCNNTNSETTFSETKVFTLKVSISSWSRNISDSCNYFASEWNACGSRKVIYSESFFWSPLNWACTFFAQIFLTSFRNQSTNISFLAKKIWAKYYNLLKHTFPDPEKMDHNECWSEWLSEE